MLNKSARYNVYYKYKVTSFEDYFLNRKSRDSKSQKNIKETTNLNLVYIILIRCNNFFTRT